MTTQTDSSTPLVDRYINTWNETDAMKRAELIRTAFADEATYRDPLLAGDGQEGIDAMIRAVHERFPGHVFTRSGPVDRFANHLRFSWALATPAGETIVRGTDFATLDGDERFVKVTGFLD